jgi:hypothetical protein
MSANFFGIARYAPIESAARAVGRIVVWVDAADDVSTEMISRLTRKTPRPLSPNTADPIAANTSSEFSSLPSPMPSVPVPANATEATATRT